MKKLILSLFAVATIFVACDKDDNLDSVTIAPEVEVSVGNPNDINIDALIERLISSDYTAPKGSASSARTSTAPCVADARTVPTGATNFISYEVFLSGSDLRAVLRSEDSPAVAGFTPLATVYLAQTGGNSFNVVLNGNIISSGESAGLIGLMSVPNFIVVENLDANGLYIERGTTAASGLDCSAAPPANWTSSVSGDITTWTHATYGSYTIQGAPFPLTGFLATVATNNSGNTVSNYAGTSSSTVSDRIRDDFDGE